MDYLNELAQYIGKKYNDETIFEINLKFPKFKIVCCSNGYFRRKTNNNENIIYCVVENDKITNLDFD